LPGVELQVVEISRAAVDGPDTDDADARPVCPVDGEARVGGAQAVAGPRRWLAADDAVPLAGVVAYQHGEVLAPVVVPPVACEVELLDDPFQLAVRVVAFLRRLGRDQAR